MGVSCVGILDSRVHSWEHEHEPSGEEMQVDGSIGARAGGFLLDDAEGF